MLSFAVIAWLSATSLYARADSGAESDCGRAALGIVEQYVLPLKEVSGLALLSGNASATSLCAVGDANFDVGRFTHERSAAVIDIAIRDIRNTVRAKAGTASQWEAVAVDGAGNVCILAEKSSRIVCLSSDLKHELGRLRLNVDNDRRLAQQWDKAPNSRGEGMILMRGGHVLVLKEKQPSLIIEFGPKGDTAHGWDLNAILAGGEVFTLPASHKLVTLKTWEFSAPLAAIAPDASELTLGPDGRLYLLSQEGRALIRLERSLGLEEGKIHERDCWPLPKQLKHAEGLVFDDEMHPWVSVDIHHTDRPNLFRLTPIDAP